MKKRKARNAGPDLKSFFYGFAAPASRSRKLLFLANVPLDKPHENAAEGCYLNSLVEVRQTKLIHDWREKQHCCQIAALPAEL
nr:hypothetical protein [uncultured Massilia sp.]